MQKTQCKDTYARLCQWFILTSDIIGHGSWSATCMGASRISADRDCFNCFLSASQHATMTIMNMFPNQLTLASKQLNHRSAAVDGRVQAVDQLIKRIYNMYACQKWLLRKSAENNPKIAGQNKRFLQIFPFTKPVNTCKYWVGCIAGLVGSDYELFISHDVSMISLLTELVTGAHWINWPTHLGTWVQVPLPLEVCWQGWAGRCSCSILAMIGWCPWWQWFMMHQLIIKIHDGWWHYSWFWQINRLICLRNDENTLGLSWTLV